MAEEKMVNCSVCGAPNPPGSKFCNECGVEIKLKPELPAEEVEIDKLLEDLIEIETTPEAEEDESLDLDKEIVDELLDSLLLETEAIPEEEEAEEVVEAEVPVGVQEFECPMCGTTLPVDATVCTGCGAEFEEVVEEPVEAVPEERAPPAEVKPEAPPKVEIAEVEPAKLRILSGRLIDLTVGVTVAVMVIYFLALGMYQLDSLNPVNVGIFFTIAGVGTLIGFALFQISTSAMTQGDRLNKEGRYAEAIEFYNRAIRTGSKPATAWTSKGVAYKRLGMYAEALKCHDIALKLDPENEIAWCNKGDVYYRMGNLSRAIECYDKAIELRPRYAIAWNNKGAALARAGKFEEAKKCHDQAIKIRPKYTVAWLNRGEVLVRLGQREEAQKCLERAKALGA